MKNKILLCMAIVALLVCIFAFSASAQEIPENSILAHIDGEGTTTYYADFESCLNYANEVGGTVKVLKGRGENTQMQKIFAYYQNIVFDLNGKVVNNVYFIASGYSLKVIDSSADKTGQIISGSYASMSVSGGSLSFDGVTVDTSFKADEGTITVENSTILGGSITSGVGTLILDRVVFKEETFNVMIESFGEGEIKLRGAEIQSTIQMMAVVGGVGYLPVSLILDDGYAFSKDGQIVCANTTSISGVTTVQHTHEGESLMGIPYSTGHTEAYECGVVSSENPTIYEHEGMEESENHKCSVCSIEFTATITYGSTTKYAIDLEEAFTYANILDEDATITLIADFEDYSKSAFYSLPYTVTLDLNGYKAGLSFLYIAPGATAVVVDTSEDKSGIFASQYENFTAVALGGTLILESGTIMGIIELSGEEEQKATFIMNGGEILASWGIITYDYASIIINNGTITASNMFEAMYSDAVDVDYQIRGGTYPLGFDVTELYDVKLGDIIKSNGECEIHLYNEQGERIDDDCLGYVGYCVILHSKGVITSDGRTHTGVCETCDITYLVGDHYSLDPVKSEEDDTVHNVNCGICNYTIESEKHTGGEATCTELAVCETCEAEYGEYDTLNHKSSEVYYEQSADGSTHTVIFKCCEAIKSTDSHTGGKATCTALAVCEMCEAEYGARLGHKYANDCDSDCDECGEARSIQHAYNKKGKCTLCGDTNGPKNRTGVIVGVVVGVLSITGACIGGFLIYWFLVRKKKI